MGKKSASLTPSAELPVQLPVRHGKGVRTWISNAFELPTGIDRRDLELGDPMPYGSFTTENLKAIGAVGLYRIST
jgi:hypothetical protein